MTTAERDRIRPLYEQTLKPRLESLEGLRLTLRRIIIKAAVIVGIPGVATWGSEFIANLVAPGYEVAISVVGFIWLALAIVYVAIDISFLPSRRTRTTRPASSARSSRRFSRSSARRPRTSRSSRSPWRCSTSRAFQLPWLVLERRPRARDMGRTPFEAAEVRRSYRTGSGRNSTTHVVFEGLFFHLDFNKALSGTTLVQPESARHAQLGERSGVRLVSLENPEFEKEFKVYATDELEARYILTPAMMERLLALRRQAEHPVFLGFKNNQAHIGVHYGRALFEPGIASSTSLESLEEMAGHFAFAEFVVRELDLNTRIWTKEVDDSLLQQRDTPEHFLHSDALTSGNLTEGGLLQVASLWARRLRTAMNRLRRRGRKTPGFRCGKREAAPRSRMACRSRTSCSSPSLAACAALLMSALHAARMDSADFGSRRRR